MHFSTSKVKADPFSASLTKCREVEGVEKRLTGQPVTASLVLDDAIRRGIAILVTWPLTCRKLFTQIECNIVIAIYLIIWRHVPRQVIEVVKSVVFVKHTSDVLTRGFSWCLE